MWRAVGSRGFRFSIIMNKFTDIPIRKWTRLTSILLTMRGGCPLMACPLSVVDWVQRPKYGDTQSSAIVCLALNVIDGHLLDPSITIICAKLKRQRFLLSLHISWVTTYNGALKVFVFSRRPESTKRSSPLQQCVDFWWAQFHFRLAFYQITRSHTNPIKLIKSFFLFLFFLRVVFFQFS